jgi:hypothetical protein
MVLYASAQADMRLRKLLVCVLQEPNSNKAAFD